MAPPTQIVSSLYNYFLTCLLVYRLLHDVAIRSLPGGVAGILGDGNCRCEKGFHMNTCLILSGYRGRTVESTDAKRCE